MKLFSVILLINLFILSGCSIGGRIEKRPLDWPLPSKLSSTCHNVEGAFIDPNSFSWDKIDASGSKYGGVRVAAWNIFGFPMGDKLITSRTFNLSIEKNNELKIDYLLDGVITGSKTFPLEKDTCNENGLTITTLSRSGTVYDKLPNNGHLERFAYIYKTNGYLYVKKESKTKSWLFYIFPIYSHSVHWFRFSEVES